MLPPTPKNRFCSMSSLTRSASSNGDTLDIISPGKEDHYTSMNKMDFLRGSLNETFKWSKATADVQPPVLQTMWNSTQVYVIRPVEEWKKLLGDYIKTL